jgi:hypothetical protein
VITGFDTVGAIDAVAIEQIFFLNEGEILVTTHHFQFLNNPIY